MSEKLSWASKWVSAAIWLGILGLLAFAVRDVRLDEVLSVLAKLSRGQLTWLVVLNAVIILLLSVRWWMILRGFGYALGLVDLVRLRLAAFAVNYFTPGPQFGGEPLQVAVLHRRFGIPVPGAASGVGIDKLIELAANLGFLLLGLGLVIAGELFDLPMQPPAAITLALLAALPVAYLGVLRMGVTPFAALAGWVAQRTGAVGRLRSTMTTVAQVEKSAGRFCRREPRVLVGAFLISTLTWAFMVLEFWWMADFLGVRMSVVQTIATLAVVRLAFLTPLPGGLGALEVSLAWLGESMGWGAAMGISLGVLIRTRDLLLGGLGLWQGGTLIADAPRIGRRFLIPPSHNG